MASVSFGLQPENKAQIHEAIFSICYYGEGGFIHSDVYNMPIYLRNFYLNKLVEVKKKEKEEVDKATKKSKPPNMPRAK